MVLFNADGSEAEMSGNGIRCLAQAVFHAGVVEPPVLRGGHRRRAAHGDGARRRIRRPAPTSFSVEMGQAKVGRRRARVGRPASVAAGPPASTSGNPHLVLHVGRPTAARPSTCSWRSASRSSALVARWASTSRSSAPDPGRASSTLVVYERGVGLTEACGTGACAAAAAAQRWGLSGPKSTVHMPGACPVGDHPRRPRCCSPATPPSVGRRSTPRGA